MLTFVLAGQFIAADGANPFALQTELRRLEGTRALGRRGSKALVDQVVSAHTAGGRLSELGRLVRQAWHAQVASVIYVLTRLDDGRGWVTKVDLVRRVPRVAERGSDVHQGCGETPTVYPPE